MLKKLISTAAAAIMIFCAVALLPANQRSESSTVIYVEAVSYDISSYTASISYSSYTYRGRGIKPTVTVKDKSGNKLTKDTDFTVSYANNTNVGTATITIKGKGKYTGTLKKTFKVKALDLSTSYAKVTIPYSSYTYSGSAIKPAVKVKFKDGDIIPTAQYTISYSNNVKVGTATITIKGKGSNVTGTYKKTFVVKPAKNVIKSITAGVGSFKLTWTKATAGATGYQVLYSTDKNFESNVHSYTSTDLSDLSENFSKVPGYNETWYVKVRSFVTKDGKATSTRYGNYSAVKSVTTLKYTEKQLKKMVEDSSRYTIETWYYNDYPDSWIYADFDGNGTKEGFAGLLNEEYGVCMELKYIDSNGKITVLKDDMNKYTLQSMSTVSVNGKKLISFDFGSGAGSSTWVYGVENNKPFEIAMPTFKNAYEHMEFLFQENDGALYSYYRYEYYEFKYEKKKVRYDAANRRIVLA